MALLCVLYIRVLHFYTLFLWYFDGYRSSRLLGGYLNFIQKPLSPKMAHNRPSVWFFSEPEVGSLYASHLFGTLIFKMVLTERVSSLKSSCHTPLKCKRNGLLGLPWLWTHRHRLEWAWEYKGKCSAKNECENEPNQHFESDRTPQSDASGSIWAIGTHAAILSKSISYEMTLRKLAQGVHSASPARHHLQ